MTLISADLSNRFIEMQKTLKPDIYIEVGAHDAEFSKMIASEINDIPILAFEASPYVFNKYSPIPGVTYINKAISDKNDFIDFEIQNDIELTAVNNSIMKRNEKKDYNYIPVESITLNSILKDYRNICLWIDCEGANREVLVGASEVLDYVSSIFIEVEKIEFWDGQWLDQDVVEYLGKFGFFLLDKDSQYENQYNCIFVKNH
jgi:FkbM family methyltransferase